MQWMFTLLKSRPPHWPSLFVPPTPSHGGHTGSSHPPHWPSLFVPPSPLPHGGHTGSSCPPRSSSSLFAGKQLLNVCGNHDVRATQLYVTSPLFPDMYPPDQNCTCRVTTASQHGRGLADRHRHGEFKSPNAIIQ